MNKERLAKFVVNKAVSIVDIMGVIDANAKGIVFVVDDSESLVGVITDGDIRRWIIRTGDLTAVAEKAMTTTPKYLFWEERKKAKDYMKQEKVTAVPIINSEMKIVDVALLSEKAQIETSEEKKSLKGVPVVIMAGGKGTRLYPFTKILPKPLIPIGDTPILERIMNKYEEYGIEEFYLTVNYKKELIKSYFADIGVAYRINYIEEDRPLGTGGSIKLIEEPFDRPLIVTNCDALIMADYNDIYDFHVNSGNKITIVSSLKNFQVPYGVLRSGEHGELIKMEEKPRLSYFINTGMYVIDPEVIELIPDNSFYHMTDLVEEVMKTGGTVGMYPISEDSFLDMGEFSEMKRMEEKLNIVSK